MAVNLSLVAGAGWQFFDDNGVPLAGGKLYTYAAGTTTPAVTYTTSAGNVANTNPIVLNAAGRVSAEVWITEGTSCKFVLESSTNVQIWSHNNIQGAGDFSAAIAAVYADLANTSNVAKGDALVGFKQSTSAGVIATAVARTVHQKFQSYVDVKDFGALGDGVQDDTTYIQNALNSVSATNGGQILIPDGVYNITNSLVVKSNTTVIMTGTVKIIEMGFGTTYETAFVTDPTIPANNIQFINPQIDANNIVPTSGIMLRYGATNVRVYGGHIRNCANSTTMPGGRGFNIEGGVDQQNITISGTNITGCWNGVAFVGGSGQANSNVSISNLTISECQVAVSLFGNTPGYPHTGEFMQAVFSNIAIRNCGHLTTFTTQAGVIVSDRGSNVSFSDIYVFNDSSYGAVGALFRGDANNISMSNVTMDGDLTEALFNFSSYAESNAYPLSANSSLDSRFINIKHIGTIPEIIVLPISGASYLTNCQFDVLTDVVTSDSPLNTNLNNKTDVYIKAQNKTSNAILQGYCADMSQYENEFSDYNSQEINFSLSGLSKAWALINGTTGTVVRSFGINSARNSAGNYTIALTRPLPSSQYVVLIEATATDTTSVQAHQITSKNGFGFGLLTYNGGVLTDKALINIAIFY
jgi:hypothetical protein